MEKVYVGKLGRAVGLKGGLRLFIESDFPEQFQKGKTFFTQKNKQLIIETINTQQDLVKFVDIDSIEEAKKLTNSLLYTTPEASKQSCILESDQFFWFDIMGCEIFENGMNLGIVSDIQRLPLDDYLLISTSEQLIKSYDKAATTFMIPYNKNFIKTVSLEKKQIEVINGLDIFEAS